MKVSLQIAPLLVGRNPDGFGDWLLVVLSFLVVVVVVAVPAIFAYRYYRRVRERSE